MNVIIKLILKDFIRFFKDKSAVILTFVVPAVLILIFGTIFGGSGGARSRVPIILVNNSDSEIAKILETRLDSSSTIRPVKTFTGENGIDSLFTAEKAKEYVINGNISAAIVFPEDFFADTSSGIKIKFYYDPKNELESALIRGTIQQTIYSEIPRVMPVLMQKWSSDILDDSTMAFTKELSGLIGEYFEINPDSIFKAMTEIDTSSISQPYESEGEGSFLDELIKFESEQLVGKEIKNPGVTRIVGGWAMMFLLFSLTGAATSLFEEKQEGSLQRLLCMPITRSHIIWSKYFYTMILGIIQLLVIFLFGWAVFNVDIFSNFTNLFIVIVISAAAAVAFGMIITAISKTLQQANGLSTLIILVMSAVGGAWFPVSLFPDWLRFFSNFTLTYWSVEAFLDVLWRQSDLSAIALNLGILLATAVIINSIALYLFEKRKVI